MFPRVVTGTLLGVLLILGAFSWRQYQAIESLQEDVRPLSGLRRANAQLVTENGALREKVEACERESSAFAGALGNLRLTTEARYRGILGPGIYFSPYAPFSALTRPFVSAFNLAPNEIAGLKSHLARAESKIDALAVANATTARDTDGNFVITIKPTAEGGPVRDELVNALRATLGAERYEYFQQLAAEQFLRCLGHFGAQERTITITRIPTGAGQYLVDEQGKPAPARQIGSSGRTTVVSDRQKLEAQLGSLAKLLPADL